MPRPMLLDRSGRTPLHHQVYDLILREIKDGELRPGDRIDSEHQLGEKYGVSRTTVKQAIQRLAQSGYVYRLQGKGTFVKSPPVSRQLNSIISFSEEIRKRGRTPISKLIHLEVIGLTESLASDMRCELLDQVICYRRLRYADEEVMGIQTSYLPYEKFKVLANREIIEGPSLYETIERLYGVKPARAIEEYRIVWPEEEDSLLIGQSKRQPAFAVRRWTYLDNGELMEYAESILRGDRYTLTIELSRNDT
jgi:GntR family transcriptional regulator